MRTPSPDSPGELSIVIPVFNEAQVVLETIKAIRTELEATVESYEIIVVDDGSTDNTWEMLEARAKVDSRIMLLGLTRNFGKEAAILAGLSYSTGAGVVVMDGDLQHPPKLLSEMVRLWREDKYEVIHAVKARRQPESLYRSMLASAFYRLMRMFSGYDLRGETDYKLLDRRVVDHYLRLSEKVRFFRGLIPWLGFRHARVSFSPDGREQGSSRWKVMKLLWFGIRAICSFSTIPMQLVTILGGIMFVSSFLLGIQTLYKKLNGEALEGFATVILLLLFMGSILMVSLGIIGQYLAMIYEELKGRPAFVISRTRNIPKDADNHVVLRRRR